MFHLIFLIIFAILTGFFCKLKINILFLSLLCIIVLIYSLYMKIHIDTILVTILTLNLAWFIPYRFRQLKSLQLKKVFLKQEKHSLYYRELEQKDERVEKTNKKLEAGIAKISQLYEITKQMNKVLGFMENLNIFGKLLKENFNFNNCRFMLLKEEDSPLIKNAYRISKKEREITQYSKIDESDYKLLNLILNKKKPLYLDTQTFKGLETSQGIFSQACVPLISENKTSSIIITDNLPKLEFRNFLIFVNQFKMELRKVRLYEKIQEQALTDSLTGSYVRRHFLQRLEEELERSRKHNMNLTFIMLDLDHFKDKNDQYGHLVGDVVLKKIAALLKSSVREIDLLGRYGGEEFCLALIDTDRSGAFNVAERIRARIENKKIRAYDEQIQITVSIGISCFPEDADNKEKLIELADQAMYKAKQNGRNRICVYRRQKTDNRKQKTDNR